jgi:ABC-type lipoprotein release transport system permease subunit
MPQLENVPPPDGESAIPSPLLHGIIIPNDQAQAMYDELSGMEYGRLFTIMDQGYSVVMPGLITIRDNAAWLMLICLIAWVAILALFITLFILGQRQEVAVMRSLGARRSAAVQYILAGVVVVTLGAALLSAGGAYALYDVAFDVALSAPSMESQRIDDYSEMPVARNTEEEQRDQLQNAFVPENKGLMILGIIGGQWLLLLLASYICSRQLSGRNPMLLMQSKEE